MVKAKRPTSDALSLQDYFDRYLPSVEAEMQAIVKAVNPLHEDFFGMMRYHLGWADAEFNPCEARSGKRVRPILCLLSCEACGGDWEQALPAGAAIEIMHNFTLVHDDIEDRDETRRGRPTVWTLWGDAHGINVGDAMFALSNLSLLLLVERGVPASIVVAACCLFNITQLALTSGQYLDIGFEGREDVSVEDYLAMIEGKTAALAACSCEMGALIAGASDAQCACLREFGRHLGLTFQMCDDILGIWGDPALTGKPAGADIARRKKSLPILHGLERDEELRALLGREKLLDSDIRRAAELLEQAGSREYAHQLAQEQHSRALAALEDAGLHGPAAQALYELEMMLLNREV
ncbi:MAG: polyprenyl synthetase family protein [Anaerolineae bacterium]|nr:polyprenyl synthetase family protein [Anaerolineae bacterium]